MIADELRQAASMLVLAAEEIERLGAELNSLKHDKASPGYPESGIDVVETSVRYRHLKVYLQAVGDPRKSERLAEQFSKRVDESRRFQNRELFGVPL